MRKKRTVLGVNERVNVTQRAEKESGHTLPIFAGSQRAAESNSDFTDCGERSITVEFGCDFSLGQCGGRGRRSLMLPVGRGRRDLIKSAEVSRRSGSGR